MSNAHHEYTCPLCGGHEFQITVEQQIRVEFDSGGDHEVDEGPGGDLAWDERSEATCTNCQHTAPLGQMVPPVPVEEVVEGIKAKILAGVADGRIPYFVGGIRDVEDYVNVGAGVGSGVRDAVSAWLRAGGIPQPEGYTTPVARVEVCIPYRDPSSTRQDWSLLYHRLARYDVRNVDAREGLWHRYDLQFDVENDSRVVGNAVATAIITLREMGLEVLK